MAKASQYKRFTVSLDKADYDAIKALGEAQKPPLKLQYMISVAVSRLLDANANKQFSFPLDKK